ncbi:tRNA (adenine-N(1)-)-methyltransferase catalytic subunit trm61 [Cladophialophora chaetospira]|uniref:tRNA (adenine(58)-N(1))-methyltransferase catalytic subunit TRM61 n=1 Tax=Cladophialophora chaetospira TaxID=386627 RepID=A0AA39CKX2_9EURO|nr:tRNA (adenine-N(1)-)-methyltransferase catalytic subunit trm61 [Cladophialophora chaetospira]
MVSTFLTPYPHTQPNDLASLHLRRDQSLPVILSTQVTSASDQGYAEGVVTNTRFGSFPHSTIIDRLWGSQIRASKVDTGSRGRPGRAKKRKADEALDESSQPSNVAGEAGVKQAEVAESGFIHVLPPTPENWTTSLPHRTQVVYTPDYSYILHRLRARPGSRLIEAGSGSGSFTHAAARAVFSGYPKVALDTADTNGKEGEADVEAPESVKRRTFQAGRDEETGNHGQVFTYEFHRERHEKVKDEMVQHGLDSVVHAMHRNVYNDGFLVYDSNSTTTPSDPKSSPRANAVFLDLPAPWEALPHLTREPALDGRPSVLDPDSTVHICTFSPCIEQAQKTVSALRRYDWIDIEMVEMQHKRVEVRRDYTGLQYDGMRGANAFAADVDEAVSRLRDVEKRLKDFHAGKPADDGSRAGKRRQNNQQQQQQDTASKLPFNEGTLVHRTEPELKTHTSYLVFAILPRAWTEADETAAQEKWSRNVKISPHAPKSQRQMKKQAKQREKSHKQNGLSNDMSDAIEAPAGVEEGHMHHS